MITKKQILILLLVSLIVGGLIMFLETKVPIPSGGGGCAYWEGDELIFMPDCVLSKGEYGRPFAFSFYEEGGIGGGGKSTVNVKMFILDFIILTLIFFVIFVLLIWLKRIIKHFLLKNRKLRIILFLIISVALGLFVMYEERPMVPVFNEPRNIVQPNPDNISWSGDYGFPFNFAHYDVLKESGYYISATNWQILILDFIITTLVIFILFMLPMWLRLIINKIKAKEDVNNLMQNIITKK